ncbi:MAG: exopolysaccharide biosynthesis protein [Alphaproteobacteria bacterium]|nr:exopolysaccharide biosynthesis protein [Alphaproteobacteria bacterium]
MRSITDVLNNLDQNVTGERVTLDDLLEALHERGFGFLLLIFSVPMALPVPVPPGINIMLALPLIILTAQQAIGRHTIWMPDSFRRKSISHKKMSGMIKAVLPWTARAERLIKPRMEVFTQGIFSHLIGIFGLIMALCVCVPLPMTNTVPSLGIALMAAGVVMRDGLAVIIGAIIGIVWVFALCAIIAFLGTEGIDFVKETIKSMI